MSTQFGFEHPQTQQYLNITASFFRSNPKSQNMSVSQVLTTKGSTLTVSVFTGKCIQQHPPSLLECNTQKDGITTVQIVQCIHVFKTTHSAILMHFIVSNVPKLFKNKQKTDIQTQQRHLLSINQGTISTPPHLLSHTAQLQRHKDSLNLEFCPRHEHNVHFTSSDHKQ